MALDAQAATLLAQIEAVGGPPVSELTPQQFRENFAMLSGFAATTPDPPASTEDTVIPGPGGDIPVRIYRPAGEGPHPGVVYFHGGGWVIGNIATHDGICHHLATEVPAVVVSADYRLSPESRFPAAVEDADAVVAWVAENAADIGIDPARLAVAGDSAGGNLAAVTALHGRDTGRPPIAFQLLIYPVTDLTRSRPSHVENGEGYMLTTEVMGWFADHYLGGADPTHPDASPLLRDDLTGVAPALVITAEFDPLRDEGEEYGERLSAAGVDATVSRYDGMIHGFATMDALIDAGGRAIEESVAALRAGLAGR